MGNRLISLSSCKNAEFDNYSMSWPLGPLQALPGFMYTLPPAMILNFNSEVYARHLNLIRRVFEVNVKAIAKNDDGLDGWRTEELPDSVRIG